MKVANSSEIILHLSFLGSKKNLRILILWLTFFKTLKTTSSSKLKRFWPHSYKSFPQAVSVKVFPNESLSAPNQALQLLLQLLHALKPARVEFATQKNHL